MKTFVCPIASQGVANHIVSCSVLEEITLRSAAYGKFKKIVAVLKLVTVGPVARFVECA